MGDSEVRALALFFFFACLDDLLAKEAASKAADEYERLWRRNPHLDSTEGVVRASFKVWQRFRSRFLRGPANIVRDSGWVFPPSLDLLRWKEFQRSVPEDEMLALIWVHILGFNEEKVAQALGVSLGTLRLRLARALRKLGALTGPQSRPLRVVKADG